MGTVRVQITMSLDGFVAGPNPSVENPLGEGGMQLHEWALSLEAWRRVHGTEGGEVNASTPVVEASQEGIGAYVMGRNMFGGGPGPWGDGDWREWWGDDPPFRAPVFVVTHHEREPLPMRGGTTFTFVTDGVEAALDRAHGAAGGSDVLVSGGASVVQQCFGLGPRRRAHRLPRARPPGQWDSAVRGPGGCVPARADPGDRRAGCRPSDVSDRALSGPCGRATLSTRADVAELVDAHGSGPCGLRLVEVQVLSSACEIRRFSVPDQSQRCRL